MRKRALTAVLMVALGGTQAHAQDQWFSPHDPDSLGSVVADGPRPETRRWYGWQIMLADAALLAAASEEPRAGRLLLWLTPAVHAAHGNGARWAGSMSLRLFAAYFGVVVAFGSGDTTPAWILFGAAEVIDSVGLAWDVKRRPLPRTAPAIDAAGDRWSLGLRHRF